MDMDQPAQIITETVPPPPPAPVNVQPSPSTPKSRKGPLIIFLVILGLILAGSLVYAGMQIGKKQTKISVSPIPTIPPSPAGVIIPTTIISTPTPNPTAGWKTYRSDKNSYSFRYPPSLEFYEGLILNYDYVEVSEKYLGEGIGGYPPGIRIYIADNPLGLSPKKWWQEFIRQQYAAGVIDQEGMLKDTIYEEKNINNYPAFIVKSTPSWELMPFSTTLFNNKKIYRITVDGYQRNEEIYWDNLYAQILSTFNFLP